MIKYNFVKLNESDSLAIQKVMSKAFNTIYFDKSEEQEEQQYIRTLVNNPDTKAYGIKYKDELIAATYYLPLDKEIYEVGRIMVMPEYQKNKIESFLLDKSIEKLKEEEKVRILFLECQKHLMPFYYKNGFKEIEESDKLYTEPSFTRKRESLTNFFNDNNIDNNNTKIVGRTI